MYRWRRHVTGEGTVLNSIRRRLTYANVMSTLAVFIALGGSSYAARASSAAARSRTARSPARSCATTRSPAARSTSHASGRVPYARNAGRLGGVTAADLKIQCPSDTFPIADVCVEKTARAAAVVRQRGADVPRRRDARRPRAAAADPRGAPRGAGRRRSSRRAAS